MRKRTSFADEWQVRPRRADKLQEGSRAASAIRIATVLSGDCVQASRERRRDTGCLPTLVQRLHVATDDGCPAILERDCSGQRVVVVTHHRSERDRFAIHGWIL